MQTQERQPLDAPGKSSDSDALFHSIETVCRRLSMGRSWLQAEIRAGRVKPVKLGRRTLIPDSELQRIVARAVSP